METTHRRIELQAPADLTYLISNASRSARAKIDLHFPPSAAPESGEDDGMRRRVEELVQMYIDATFAGAKQSLSINGLDAAEMDKHLARAGSGQEEIEPYDHRLAKRIQDTSAQIESLALELANLRRAAPAEAAEKFNTRFAQDSEAWGKRKKEAEDELLKEAGEVELVVQGLDREEEMRRDWDRGTSTLVGVKDGIGGTVARLERASDAVGYLEGQ